MYRYNPIWNFHENPSILGYPHFRTPPPDNVTFVAQQVAPEIVDQERLWCQNAFGASSDPSLEGGVTPWSAFRQLQYAIKIEPTVFRNLSGFFFIFQNKKCFETGFSHFFPCDLPCFPMISNVFPDLLPWTKPERALALLSQAGLTNSQAGLDLKPEQTYDTWASRF